MPLHLMWRCRRTRDMSQQAICATQTQLQQTYHLASQKHAMYTGRQASIAHTYAKRSSVFAPNSTPAPAPLTQYQAAHRFPAYAPTQQLRTKNSVHRQTTHGPALQPLCRAHSFQVVQMLFIRQAATCMRGTGAYRLSPIQVTRCHQPPQLNPQPAAPVFVAYSPQPLARAATGGALAPAHCRLCRVAHM